MSAPESRNHWKSLADQLGADVPEVPETQHDTMESEVSTSADDASTSEETASPPPSLADESAPEPNRREPNRREPNPRPTANWDALANQLGIEVPEESPISEPPDVPALDQPPEAQQPPDDDADELQGDRGQDEVMTVDYAVEVEELVVMEREEVELDDDETTGERDEDVEDLSTYVETEEETEEETSAHREVTRRRRRRRGRHRSESEESPTSDEASTELDELAESEMEVDIEEEVETTVQATETTGERDEIAGRRRRRRRRRGRDRDPRTQQDETPSSDDDDDDDDDLAEAMEADQEADDRPVKHRKIPTWDQAIGVIVESNLSTREKSPPDGGKSGGSRRRGRRRR